MLKSLVLLALAGFCCAQLQFGSGRVKSSGDNGGAVNTRLGLISSILGQHPTGGNGNTNGNFGGSSSSFTSNSGGSVPQTSSLQEGRNNDFCCCAPPRSRCPAGDPDYDDYPDFDLDTRVNPDVINTRIVNNPSGSSGSFTSCPSGQTRCCYSSQSYVKSLGSSCLPLGSSGSNQPWRQGCSENIPFAGSGKTCGQRNFRPLSSLGKGEASPEEFPWTCLILDGNNQFIGTCAIIPENSRNDISRGTTKVITAAHKLKNVGIKDILKIRVLEYDANAFVAGVEKERHQEFTVVKITEHPNYKPGRFINDVSILTVDRTINLLNHNGINAACIPTCDNMFDFKFSNGTGTRCWVAGWGKDNFNGRFRTTMHKVDVPLYDERLCEQSLRQALRRDGKISSSNNLKLHPSEICAGGETGKDACDGDGGAPLVCQALSGRWYAVGLVTWGVNCAQTDVPGVYARVSYFANWIGQN